MNSKYGTGQPANAQTPIRTDPLVRAVIRSDLEKWEPIWEGYNIHYQRTVPVEITRMTWSRFFDVYEPMHALVAEKDGELVGLAHYLFHRSTTIFGPTCYLQDLFTIQGARRQGVGRALIEAVYDRARVAGSTRVYWQTHETNAIAMKL